MVIKMDKIIEQIKLNIKNYEEMIANATDEQEKVELKQILETAKQNLQRTLQLKAKNSNKM